MRVGGTRKPIESLEYMLLVLASVGLMTLFCVAPIMAVLILIESGSNPLMLAIMSSLPASLIAFVAAFVCKRRGHRVTALYLLSIAALPGVLLLGYAVLQAAT